MNINHLINTEIDLAQRYIQQEKTRIKTAYKLETDRALQRLQIPPIYHIVLTKLIDDAELFTDQNKLELMNALIEQNKNLKSQFPWFEQ